MAKTVAAGWLALALLVSLTVAPAGVSAAAPTAGANVYDNPLMLNIGDGATAETCADPAVMRAVEPDEHHWYLYCTTDPLTGDDRDAAGNLRFRLVPTYRSLDLVEWDYVGDAFSSPPEWLPEGTGMWAPFVTFHDGRYYLYYTAPETDAGGSAIGVATSDSPTGPWTDAGAPVVAPRPDPDNPQARLWTFDPEVVEGPDGTRYLFFGSYYGGLFARELSKDGLTTDPATERRITIGNRYEAADVVQRDGWYHLFVSATNCCAGPLTGYSVFVGRSRDPLGPYVDRTGASLLDGRVGGTPVISMNGNRWVGPGHSQVVTDLAGQDWLYYHAIDRHDPYLTDEPGINKRPVLVDRLDWIDGWPTVRGGQWASDSPQHGPVAQPGMIERPPVRPFKATVPGAVLPRYSTDFDGSELESAWEWVREPEPTTYAVEDGLFAWQTQAADLHVDSNNASVLTRPVPAGNYVVDTRLRLDVPPEGCCFNYVQAGLVLYGDDDRFIKLTHVSIWETRQTEFAKEWIPPTPGWPRYGNTVVGPPDEWTWLRIVKRDHGGEEHYTAYTSDDGRAWVRGGTWTHDLGGTARIGLVAMGGEGFTAEFDHVTVSRVKRGGPGVE